MFGYLSGAWRSSARRMRGLTRTFTLDLDVTKEVDSLVQGAVERFDSTPLARPDVANSVPLFMRAKGGRSIASQILPQDVQYGGASPFTLLIFFTLLGLLAPLMGSALMAFAGGAVGTVLAALASALGTGLIALFFAAFTLRVPHTSENEHRSQGDIVLGTQLDLDIAARHEQCAASARDTSREIVLGTALGALQARGDLYAYDPGQQAVITHNELTSHLFVFGPTNAGKTSGMLRPLFAAWCQGLGGALVLDGKGLLPMEFVGGEQNVGITNYSLVSPSPGTTIALLEGLEPADIANALADTGETSSGDSSSGVFFTGNARGLIYHIAMAMALARGFNVQVPYTLAALNVLVKSGESRKALLEKLKVAMEGKTDRFARLAKLSIDELQAFESLADDTKGDIQGTASVWISPLMQSPGFIDWVTADIGTSTVDVTACLRGARIGINLPDSKYGQAAAPVANLLKAKVYRALRNRGDKHMWDEHQRPVMILMDEAYLLISEDEKKMAGVLRSQGGSIVAATQNYDQLEEKLGAKGAAAMIDSFRGLVCVGNVNKSSHDVIRERARLIVRRKRTARLMDLTLIADRAASSDMLEIDNEPWAHEDYTSSSGKGADPSKVTAGRPGNFCELELAPLLDEMPFTIPKQHALVHLERAGAPRRDIIRLGMVIAPKTAAPAEPEKLVV